MMTEYGSGVAPSVIDALHAKVAKRSYGKYLVRMTLRRVRSFEDRDVSFDFPVTALVGPNGGGKTTVLGAAALIYEDVEPRRFFAKSGKYDRSMQNWQIQYELIDRDENARLPISRTASYLRSKWNRSAVSRSIFVFGVDRTLPASERKELARCIGSGFVAKQEDSLPLNVVQAAERVLGKQIRGYTRLRADSTGKINLFVAQTQAGDQYSEFHFGAGEASVIRIITAIENTGDNSLILIEEIENGLHPVATRRLVEYLIEVAQRKSAQIIFTTHSDDALVPLPSSAIWAAYEGRLTQGRLDVRALRTITGRIEARLAIFVEDKFAEKMVLAALRHWQPPGVVDLAAIKIHGMGGAEAAFGVHVHHERNPSVGFKSICILDGDKEALAAKDKWCVTLPGAGDPEAHIYNRVLEKLDALKNRLAVAMHLPSSRQDEVEGVVRRAALANSDRHTIFREIGDSLDFTSEDVVTHAFLAQWAQIYPNEVCGLLDSVRARIPLQAGDSAARSGAQDGSPAQ